MEVTFRRFRTSPTGQQGTASLPIFPSIPPPTRLRTQQRASLRPGSSRGQGMPVDTKVYFENAEKQRLVGLLRDAGSPGVSILCHGFADTKDACFLPGLAAALAAEGQSSLRFDFTGNGESEGEFVYAGYWREVEDLRVAVDWLKQQGLATTGIAGHSKAGSVVIMYTAKYGDVPLVANISGRFTLNEGITERFGKATMERVKKEGRVWQKDPHTGVEFWLTQESVDERIAIGDMHQFCKAVPKTVSVLDIHGEVDKTINMMDAIRYADATPGATLHVVPGGNHTFSELGPRRELLSYVVPFLCGRDLPSKN